MSEDRQEAQAGPPIAESLGSSTLEEALSRHQIALEPEQVQLLDRYCRLRWQWNQRMNMTRHNTFDQFVARDVIDSLSFARCLQPDEVILDVGTGSGVPGVILFILRPDLQVFVSETVAKRARAVADIVSQLGLKIPVFIGRAEKYLEVGGWQFHSLVIRAVAPLSHLLRWFVPHWESFDRMLVLKGPRWTEERGQARHYGLMHGLALRIVDRYHIPGTGAESVLLQLCPEERLIPPHDCRLRKLAYEAPPPAIVESPQPGPFQNKGSVIGDREPSRSNRLKPKSAKRGGSKQNRSRHPKRRT
ncbi:MAG: 16S rRNA (guanine(527)-N(7))-methyltransferase RsmG [Thermogutta sp.]